jgi:hypothetical protein
MYRNLVCPGELEHWVGSRRPWGVIPQQQSRENGDINPLSWKSVTDKYLPKF